MKAAGYHLAQINVARMIAPIDDPIMADFVAQLDEINAVADQSEGFVWRLQTEDGNATNISAFEDDRILINMSVWESVEALHQYTYRSQHAGVFRNRQKWFEPYGGPYVALWWVPSGHIPSAEEGKERLEMLRLHGPTPEAFTFKQWFPPPDEISAEVPSDIGTTKIKI